MNKTIKIIIVVFLIFIVGIVFIRLVKNPEPVSDGSDCDKEFGIVYS